MNVLGIGSHPDDIEFGCFATLAKHLKKGDNVSLVILTKGELGGDPIQRVSEAEEAGKVLGISIFWGNFSDGSLRDDYNTVSYLEKVISEVRATVVYTHSRNDRHQDHRNTALASIAAARQAPEVYSYETPSVISAFSPTLFIDITGEFEAKTRAIACHKSQEKKGYMAFAAVEGLARYRGFQCGNHGSLCEAFEIVRVYRTT